MNPKERRAAQLALFLLLLGVLAYHADVLLLDRVWFFHDLRHHHHPWRAWAAATWLADQVPLWAPVAHGFPLMADGQTGVLYPPNLLLYRLFSPERALALSVVSHHAWGVLGGFVLARAFGRNLSSSMLAGVAFGFSGFWLTKLVYLGMFQVISWIPWVTAGLVRGVLRGGGHWPWSAVALGLMWLCGHPQLALYGSYIAFFIAAWVAIDVRAERGWRPWLGMVAVAIGGLGVAAPQLYATLELVGQGMRDGGVPEAFAGMGSLPPEELLGFVFPEPFGMESPAEISETYHHHGDGYAGRGVTFWDTCFYVGVVVTLLSAWAGWLRLARMWWVLAGLSLVLMLGEHTPLYGLFRLLPGMEGLRFPARAGIGVALAASQLAALGADRLQQDWVRRPARLRRLGNAMMGAVAVLALVAGLARGALELAAEPLEEGLTEALVREAPAEPLPLPTLLQASVPPPVERSEAEARVKARRLLDELSLDTAPWSRRVAWPLALMGLAGLWLARANGRGVPGRTLLLFVGADLCVFTWGYNPVTPVASLQRPRTADAFLGEPGPFRVTALDRRVDPVDDMELMSANLGLLVGAEDVIVPSPLRTVRNDAYLAQVGLDIGLDKGANKVAAFTDNRHLADLSGVRFLTTLHELSLPGLELRDEVSVAGGDTVRIYENLQAMERAFVVGCTREVEGAEASLAALLEVDPRREAVVEGRGLQGCSELAATVEVERLDASRLRADVGLEAPGWLVFTETDYPGMQVVVDGERVEHTRTDFLFIGLPLAAGAHVVHLIYEPWALLWLMLLSSLFTSVLLVWVVADRTRQLRRQWKELRRREQELYDSGQGRG